MDYCVAIRTLGKAGEKYQQELDSIIAQTIKPKKVLVYIPYECPLPKETVGIEKYIRCNKGMVAQRALSFEEVDTPLCLFLDDDVYLPPNAAQILIESLNSIRGDCIAADTFKNQEMSLLSKITAIITNWATPRFDDKWAFKIGYTGAFSYNAHPSKDVYLSQSAAGPCSLWRMEALKKIHYEDELWMDNNGFAYGDDMLFFYKLYRNGGKLLVHYNTGILHLDAQSARKGYIVDCKKYYIRSLKWFCLWWRTQIDANDVSKPHKVLSTMLYCLRVGWDFMLHCVLSIIRFSPKIFFNWAKGIRDGYRFVHSADFKSIPNYIMK